MEKYSDILRRLADLLDVDFRGNLKAVVSELAGVFSSLSKQSAQQSVQADELACDDIYHDFLLQWEEVNFCDVCGTPIRR